MTLRKFGSPTHVYLSGQAFFRLTERFVGLILELESETVTTLCCFHYDSLSLHKLYEAICPNTHDCELGDGLGRTCSSSI
jgi:hypothetical protein